MEAVLRELREDDMKMETPKNRGDLQMALLVVVGILIAAFAYQFYLLHTTTREMFDSHNRQLTSYQLATELRQSSDDLTRMARTYAVTGDPLYAKQYQAVLDIRNGKVSRPQQYHRVYWDFVTDESVRPRPDSTETISLQQLMKNAGFTDEEFALLSETEKRSNDLVKLETRAMHAVRGEFEDGRGGYTFVGAPDLELARDLLHGKEYHRIKAGIMSPLDEFFTVMERRTSSEVEQTGARLDRVQTLFVLLLVLTVAAIMLLVYNGRRQTMMILGGRPDELGGLLGEVAQGNLAVTMRRALNNSVYQLIGTTVEKLRALIVQVRDGAGVIHGEMGNLLAHAQEIRKDSDQMLSIVEQNAATLEELTASIGHVAGNAEEVRKTVEKAEEVSAQSVASVANVAGKVRGMEETVADVGQTIERLSARSNEISGIVNVIREIAEQTNLLALNAAIEAARAGESGRGFAVVADEVRKLAERSSLATVDISDKIANVRKDTETTLVNVQAAVSAAKSCVATTDSASARIGEIQREMASAVIATQHIANGTREQSIAVNEIAHSVERVSEHTYSTNELINKAADIVGSLDGQSQTLKETVSLFRL